MPSDIPTRSVNNGTATDLIRMAIAKYRSVSRFRQG
jgi:hypothetical protein